MQDRWHPTYGKNIRAAADSDFGAAQVAAQAVGKSMVRPGYLFVEFAAEAVHETEGKSGSDVIEEIGQRFGVQSVEKAFPFLDQIALHRTLTPETDALRQIYSVQYSGPYRPALVAGELARNPAVIMAEPQPVYDLLGQTSTTPNDPRYSDQTHLDFLRLPDAWQVAKGEQANVVIAVVDSGTQWQHEDLEANLWTNPNEIPDNGIDDDNNGFVDDVHGWNFSNNQPDVYGDGENATHGTLVSGTANAVSDNATGIAGAAWNARLMPINAGCSDSPRLCRTLDGVLYAAMMGAAIVNCSFGGTEYSETARRVYEAAFADGTLAVAAAGNEGANVDDEPHYPSGYPVTLSVGGIGKAHTLNQYNFGRSVNVFAPSVDINTTAPENQYALADGTSLATPLTSGVAALVKTAFPDYSPAQIREQIRLTADNIDSDQVAGLPGEFGRGKVNAHRAVTEPPQPAIRLSDLSYENEHGSLDLRTGDVVHVALQVTNHLGDATGASVAIRTDADYLDFGTQRVDGVTMSGGSSTVLEFSFEITSNAPDDEAIRFYTEIQHGTLTDTPDLFTIPINQTAVATHNTPALRVSITREGNIGYTGYQGGEGVQGNGFRPIDRNGIERDPLFEGGLLVATSSDAVSNSVRGVASPGQDDHFRIPEGESMQISSPGTVTTQEGRLVLDDSRSGNPIGVRILQESYTDHAPGYEDIFILKYTIDNTTSALISDLHVGLFFDWDVDLEDPTMDQAYLCRVAIRGLGNGPVGKYSCGNPTAQHNRHC